MFLTDFSIFVTLFLLIGLSGFFSASEIALLSLPRLRAQQWSASPTPTGRALAKLLSNPAAMLGTILISITAVNYASEAIAASWILQKGWPLWTAIVGMAVLVIVFAEIVPILYAAANPERVARFVALPVRMAAILLAFPARVISALAGLVGGKDWPRGSLVTLEELKAIVSVESEHAVLEEEEKEMLHSIFEFADKTAKDVMIPRQNIVSVSSLATVREVASAAFARRVSRLPVFREELEELIGVVFVKDLLQPLKEGKSEAPITEFMRPIFAVPETKQVSELLAELRRRKQMLAFVQDRAGRTIGLVTMEDLLEEIVGDIFDEYDLATPAVEKRAEEVVVDGRMSLSEAGELLGAELPEGRYSTVAGLLLNRLGTVPREGESVEADGFLLTARRMDGHRIARVGIRRASPREPRSQEREAKP